MKRYIIIVFMICSVSGFAQNQNTETSKLPEPQTIEVVGTASKQILPDRIFISIVLRDKIVGDKDYNITEQEDRMKDVLKKCNIDLSNLTLTDATSGVITGKRRDAVIVAKNYTLQVASANEVAKVFKELYDADIKEYAIQKSENSQIESIRKEVRIAAIKAAKEKADYLLTAIGEKTGKPIEIKEIEEVPKFARNAVGNRYAANEVLDDVNYKKNEVDFEKIEVRFSYYIRYSIR